MIVRRLAVWGDPIGHSRSPILHGAAYAQLGLDWHYDRRRVDEVGFTAALGELDESWLGLSVTMPLKGAAYRASVARDRHAELTQAVNTLVLSDEGATGSNTDVGGIVDALRGAGVRDLGTVRILGSGATAASALTAAVELGAEHVEIRARRPERAEQLIALGDRLNVSVAAMPLSAVTSEVDATLATLPSGVSLAADIASSIGTHGGLLFDAAYAPWPSDLAQSWAPGASVVSGLEMLLHQAVRQVRVFLHGTQETALPNEPAVLAAMRAALADADGTEDAVAGGAS